MSSRTGPAASNGGARGFDEISGDYVMGGTISGGDGPPDVVLGAQVTSDFFAVAAVAPLIGPSFPDAETEPTLRRRRAPIRSPSCLMGCGSRDSDRILA